jgi:hypothetical protein
MDRQDVAVLAAGADYERPSETHSGLRYVAFRLLKLQGAAPLFARNS